MRNEKYSRFLSRMRALSGVEFLSPTEEAQLNSYFQRNIRFIWEAFPWPEICPTEELEADSDGLIPLTGYSDHDIGEVLGIWSQDPDGNSCAAELAYKLTPDGIKLVRAGTSSVWVHYRQRVPDFEGDAYDAAESYERGDQVYDEDEGRFYVALTDSSAKDPATNPSYWEELEIPYRLFEYVVQASYADGLRAEGMNEKANAQMAFAGALLEQEYDKIQRQEGQKPRRTVIRTHGTMQAWGRR